MPKKDIAGKKMMVKTVDGSQISINATNGVSVDSAKVVKADIETSNERRHSCHRRGGHS